MRGDEIWESNINFKSYKKEDFKMYDKGMVTLTNKQQKDIVKEEADCVQDCINFPHNELVDRCEPCWYNHPAKPSLVHIVVLLLK